MHEYSTFWIQEEFRLHYFYKSDILHRFFDEYLTDQNTSNYLQSQFNYITRFIPYHQLIDRIKKFHQYQIKVTKVGNKLELEKQHKTASVFMHEKHLTILSHSVEEADTLLFQPLKVFDPSFFIIEFGTTNSGWISPVKKEIFLKKALL